VNSWMRPMLVARGITSALSWSARNLSLDCSGGWWLCFPDP